MHMLIIISKTLPKHDVKSRYELNVLNEFIT